MCSSLAGAGPAAAVPVRTDLSPLHRHRNHLHACGYASSAVAASRSFSPLSNLSIAPRHGEGQICRIAAGAERAEALPENPDEQKERLGVAVKVAEGKPRIVLKFIWMEKNIGLALDQVVPGHGTIPLSPYYFWPRKDAWEELKTLLEGKPWISQKRMIILLNQATDIINLWQQSGSGSLQ
ncbi:unnamed protein product [Spirodela intermedia]|uniref:30S ribosomal protein 3, chloroplastic n=1 Tax=Spirodela intermedia TaxID=51605 RepID=A0A7I8KD88_SPIIN|nr:unnamed protein product [Spirodela intermedia]